MSRCVKIIQLLCMLIPWGCTPPPQHSPTHDTIMNTSDLEVTEESNMASDSESDTSFNDLPDTSLPLDGASHAESDMMVLFDHMVSPIIDMNLCQQPLRCRSRVVEGCDPNTGTWMDIEVCSREERCISGGCERLPSAYGQACRAQPDLERCQRAGLVCGGRAAIPFCQHQDVMGTSLIEDGLECYSGRDCISGLCTLEGICSQGMIGDRCRDRLDCADDRVCASDNTCE